MFRHCMHGGPDPRERGFWSTERERAFARFGGGRHAHFERFFAAGGGPRERFFDAGDLQLLILSLLAEKPSYGYELIKAIEERMGGGYAPSPGVVYPTLTMLEERGFARIDAAEGSRKVYAITDEGRAELQAHKDRLQDLTERFDEGRQRSHWARSRRIRSSFLELRQAILRSALRGRQTGKEPSDEQVNKIVEAIQQAVKAIDAI